VQQFFDGFMFTAGGVAAILGVFAVAMFCEFVTKLMESRGREEIRNAIVDNAASICGLAERMKERRSEFE
jgi:hypothetical protein